VKGPWGVILSLAVVAAPGACQKSDGGPATTPEPAPVTEWVVEDGAIYSRSDDAYRVVCIPAEDLDIGYGEGDRWKEIIPDDQTVAKYAERPDPCPVGTLGDQYPPGVAG
jgi:hypothetical protein